MLNKIHKTTSMIPVILTISVILVPCFAQETYNLEVIFKKTTWEQDSIYAYGYSMSTLGDLNQDGYDDVIFLVNYTHIIRGYIYYGGDPMDSLYDDVVVSDSGELCPVCTGDLNADGVKDVIIGQTHSNDGYGAAQVYFGSPDMDSFPNMIFRGEGGEYGMAVACGDVNGDTYDDLIVGAYAYPFIINTHGRVYVYFGGALLDTTADVIFNGYGNEHLGISVGSGGDLNSDGYEDLVVGADENWEAYFGAGKVYVFFGGEPMDTIPDSWIHGEGVNHYLGWFGCDIMQMENDYDMMITGTSMYPYGFPNYAPGKVYFLNGGDPMDSFPDAWMVGDGDSSSLSMWCCKAGDVDGDSNEDGLAGAPVDYNFKGTGYVWLAGPTMDGIPDAYLRGTQQDEMIGWMVASAGDVNNDGRDEVMFNNYVALNPTVWICKYTGPSVAERTTTDFENGICVYPTICQTTLYVKSDFSEVIIQLFNICGQEVMREETKSGKGRFALDVKLLPNGIYFVKVSHKTTSLVRKVILVR